MRRLEDEQPKQSPYLALSSPSGFRGNPAQSICGVVCSAGICSSSENALSPGPLGGLAEKYYFARGVHLCHRRKGATLCEKGVPASQIHSSWIEQPSHAVQPGWAVDGPPGFGGCGRGVNEYRCWPDH